MITKKELSIFSEPEIRLYNHGAYTGKELGYCNRPYFDRSKKLVDALVFENVQQILGIDINGSLPFIKTFEDSTMSQDLKDTMMGRDIRNKPYVCFDVLIDQKKVLNGLPIASGGNPIDKDSLLYRIESYIDDNMGYKALAVVHPALIDFVTTIIKRKYNTNILSLNDLKFKS